MNRRSWKLDVRELSAALNDARFRLGVSWRELAEDAGVSPSTLTRLTQGKRPDVDGLVALLDWLGTTDLAPFVRYDGSIGGCPHCPDGHDDPSGKPWSVCVGSARDGDGQPVALHVAPSDGSHVAESDAEWLRRLIARCR